MKDVTFGRYYPGNSFVHKMDARIKLLLSIAYIVGVFLVKGNSTTGEYDWYAFLMLFVFVILVTIVARVPFFSIIRSVKGILFFVLLSAALQIFFNSNGPVLVEWGVIVITEYGLLNAGYIVARIMLIIMGTSLLTLTTTPVEIADGIESLLKPLKLVRFPVHEFALIMSIALRYIPILIDETDRIIKAQKARGADFESGNLLSRVKALIPILIPLLISAFRRADELGDAMDSRCYNGSKGRTKYKKQKLSVRDLIGTLIVGGLIVGVVLMNIYL